MKNTLENIYALLKNPDGDFTSPEGERYIKVIRYSLYPFKYSKQENINLDPEFAELNYIYAFCRGVDYHAVPDLIGHNVLKNIFYLKETTRVLSRILDNDKFQLTTVGVISDLLKQKHMELELNLEANFFNDNALYDVLDLSHIKTQVLIPEIKDNEFPIIHLPADIERPDSVTPEEALFAHIVIKRLLGMNLIDQATTMWMGHVYGDSIFILDIEDTLLVETRQENHGLTLHLYESKGVKDDFESELTFILGAVNALFIFGQYNRNSKQVIEAVGTPNIFNEEGKIEVAATTYSMDWAIERLESIEGSYATNFKYLVDERAVTGNPFMLGEYMLNYLGKNKKVPIKILAELSYYHRSKYDPNFDTSLTVEVLREELKKKYV